MLAAVLAAFAAFGAADDRPAVKTKFAPPPEDSLKALKATVSKPFSAGYVFIDGKYIAPPYKVERYGTVVRINGIQVTKQVVPWEEFLKTQNGVKTVKNEPAGSAPAETAAPPPPPPPPPKASAKDDDDASLDDLFDDEPAPRRSSASSASRASAPRPKRQPAATVSYVFEGTFAMNEKARALLNRVNDFRTRIDKQLRSGGYFFFSSSYPVVSGDGGAAKRILEKLPDLQKNNPELEGFVNAMNRAGLSYLPQQLMNDLFRNRIDYLQLVQRKKADQNRNEWSGLIDNL